MASYPDGFNEIYNAAQDNEGIAVQLGILTEAMQDSPAYRQQLAEQGAQIQQALRGTQQLAPPVGYRPGIDPEWNYFTPSQTWQPTQGTGNTYPTITGWNTSFSPPAGFPNPPPPPVYTPPPATGNNPPPSPIPQPWQPPNPFGEYAPHMEYLNNLYNTSGATPESYGQAYQYLIDNGLDPYQFGMNAYGYSWQQIDDTLKQLKLGNYAPYTNPELQSMLNGFFSDQSYSNDEAWQAYNYMMSNGITPEQMAQLSGVPVGDINAWIQANVGNVFNPGSSSQPAPTTGGSTVAPTYQTPPFQQATYIPREQTQYTPQDIYGQAVNNAGYSFTSGIPGGSYVALTPEIIKALGGTQAEGYKGYMGMTGGNVPVGGNAYYGDTLVGVDPRVLADLGLIDYNPALLTDSEYWNSQPKATYDNDPYAHQNDNNLSYGSGFLDNGTAIEGWTGYTQDPTTGQAVPMNSFYLNRNQFPDGPEGDRMYMDAMVREATTGRYSTFYDPTDPAQVAWWSDPNNQDPIKAVTAGGDGYYDPQEWASTTFNTVMEDAMTLGYSPQQMADLYNQYLGTNYTGDDVLNKLQAEYPNWYGNYIGENATENTRPTWQVELDRFMNGYESGSMTMEEAALALSDYANYWKIPLQDIAQYYQMSPEEITGAADQYGYTFNYAEGGQVGGQDQIIDLTVAVIMGRIKGQEGDQIIEAFIAQYGGRAYQQLREQVLASIRPGAQTDGLIQGPGSGMEDQIPGQTADGQGIAVSPGEYIVPADVVSGLGDGSSEAGAQQLDDMLRRVRTARHGDPNQPPPIDQSMVMPG